MFGLSKKERQIKEAVFSKAYLHFMTNIIELSSTGKWTSKDLDGILKDAMIVSKLRNKVNVK